MNRVIIECKIRIIDQTEFPLRKDIDIKETLKTIIKSTLNTEFEYIDIKELDYYETEVSEK